MPKEKKRSDRSARFSFFTSASPSVDSLGSQKSEESEDSQESGEFSHIPIPEEEIDALTAEFAGQVSTQTEEELENRKRQTMEQLAAQLEKLTQQLTAISNKQTEQDSALNQLRVSNTVRHHQVITDENGNSAFRALSRIPDPIKGIPSFDGNRKQLHAWLNTAETTLEKFRPLVTNDVYDIYIQAVFNKIEGRAKDIICLAGSPTSFDEVKTILIESLGDRQELSTYKARLWANKQTPDMSIKLYYNKTKEIVQNIKTISKQDPMFNAHWDAILKFINQDALAAFIAGLRSPYQGYAQASGPKDLEDAYAFLCKFQSTEKIAETHKTNNSHKPNHFNKNQNKEAPRETPKETPYQNQKPFPPAEPMDTSSIRSKLTLNKRTIYNHELDEEGDSEHEESGEDLDLNFQMAGAKEATT